MLVLVFVPFSVCDMSCTGGCTGSGPSRCAECANGFEKIEATCEGMLSVTAAAATAAAAWFSKWAAPVT